MRNRAITIRRCLPICTRSEYFLREYKVQTYKHFLIGESVLPNNSATETGQISLKMLQIPWQFLFTLFFIGLNTPTNDFAKEERSFWCITMFFAKRSRFWTRIKFHYPSCKNYCCSLMIKMYGCYFEITKSVIFPWKMLQFHWDFLITVILTSRPRILSNSRKKK